MIDPEVEEDQVRLLVTVTGLQVLIEEMLVLGIAVVVLVQGIDPQVERLMDETSNLVGATHREGNRRDRRELL